MASIKNFGFAGVSSDVQLGKAGGRLSFSASEFSLHLSDGSTLAQLNIPTSPTATTHAASKEYVDSVASGLDVKKSVRACSTSNITGTYTAANETQSAGSGIIWSGVSTTLIVDGVTLADNDRVLLAGQTTQAGNGIVIYNKTGGTFTRATDADNAVSSTEVSGGMFTFCEEGTNNADTGYVLSSPNGAVTFGTDNLVFTQFSGAGQITAGTGIVKTGNTLDLDLSELGTDTTIAGTTDYLVFRDTVAGSDKRITSDSYITSTNILTNASGNNPITGSDGILVSTNDIQLSIDTLPTTTASVAGDLIALGDVSVAGTHIARTATNFLATDNKVLSNSAGVNPITVGTANGISLVDVGTSVKLDLAISALVGTTAASTTDELVLDSAGTSTNKKRSLGNLITDLKLITETTGSNPIAVSAAVANRGLTVTGKTVGLDITGTPTIANPPVDADTLLVYDNSTATIFKTSILQLTSSVGGGGLTNRINDADSNTFVDTAATAEHITMGVGPSTNRGAGTIADINADSITFTGTNANAASAVAGGAVSITAGIGDGAGAGGAITLTGGAPGVTGIGGAITITAGAGGSTSGAGGATNISGGGGTATNSSGGALNLNGGNALGTGVGANVVITGGAAPGAGAGGDIILTPGTSTSGTAGHVNLDGDNFPLGATAAFSIWAVGNAGGGAGSVSAVTAVNTGGNKLLVFDDVDNNIKWVDTAGTVLDSLIPIFKTVSGDTGTSAVADLAADTLTIAGGSGIDTVGTAASDTITVNLNINANLTALGADADLADLVPIYDTSATSNKSVTVQELTNASLSGAIKSFKFSVPLNANGNTDPASSTIPASATVTKVLINVTVADSTATLTIGTTASGAAYADATTNDPSIVGIYVAELMSTTVGALRGVVAGSALTAGSNADVIVEYKLA